MALFQTHPPVISGFMIKQPLLWYASSEGAESISTIPRSMNRRTWAAFAVKFSQVHKLSLYTEKHNACNV